MSKKILLIENDAALAADLSRSLEESGFDVRVTGDGRVGLELAREWGPSAVVLCVELPGMSGYLVCQKLRKDDALRSIPLVLTSAEATEETFDKHRTLKARADEYLLKPYAPGLLLSTLEALVGLPEPAEDEEIVSLEDEMGLADLSPETESELAALDLDALPDEPAPSVSDDDLALLDQAFDEIAMPGRDGAGDALDLALAGGAEPTAAEQVLELDDEDAAADPALVLDPGSDEALEATGALDGLAVARGAGDAAMSAAREEAARAAGRARSAEEELAALRARLAEAEARAGDAESRAEEAQAETRRARDEAAEALTRIPELEGELEALRTELAVARGEVEGARGEVEQRTAELRARVSELEATNARNEERVLRAYQRLKSDERVKEKARKALAIAAQLLEEGVEAGATQRERRPDAATNGRG